MDEKFWEGETGGVDMNVKEEEKDGTGGKQRETMDVRA